MTIELFWVDPTVPSGSDNAYISMGDPIMNGAKYGLDSYFGHQFLVRLSPHIAGVEAKFKKGKEAEEFTVTYDAKRKILNAQAAKSLASLKNKIKAIQEKANPSVTLEKGPVRQAKQINGSTDVVETVRQATAFCQDLRDEAFTACMASNIFEDITRLTEAKTQLTKFRDTMSWRLRNYTCIDDTLKTSEPIYSYPVSLLNEPALQVDVLLNKSHSKIWKVDNFISDAECEVLMKHGKPLLRRATVAAEDGSSTISENRKANQAAYNMHRQNPETDPLW